LNDPIPASPHAEPAAQKESQMKSHLRFILMTAMATICIATGSAHAVKIATPAPGFNLKDLNGNNVCLESLKGKVVILNFWSTSCAPCVAELPSLNALYRELKANNLVVLGISVDSSSKAVKEMANKQHLEYPVLMDSSQEVYFDSYALFGQPVSVIVDQAGIVQDKIVGQVDWTSAKMKTRIQTLLKKGH
jgi:peroxiredoxin